MQKYLIYILWDLKCAIKFKSQNALWYFLKTYHIDIQNALGSKIENMQMLEWDHSMQAETVYFADVIEDRNVLAKKIIVLFG